MELVTLEAQGREESTKLSSTKDQSIMTDHLLAEGDCFSLSSPHKIQMFLTAKQNTWPLKNHKILFPGKSQ
jgi:hypothetical protein